VNFLDIYSTELTTELGSADVAERFTTVLRKRYANEGQRVFNERTNCFTKRGSVPLVDGTGEYDLESTVTDYIRPSMVGASIKMVDASANVSYLEGDDFRFVTEEELNQQYPGWRAASAGTPTYGYIRSDGGAHYVGLYPAPDVPSGETWTLFWPYVAQPVDMSADGDEPWSVSSNVRITLRPYHRAIVHYAAAMLEKLRKDYVAMERQMKLFAAFVASYQADQAPPRGTSIRFAQDYRRRLRSGRAVNPFTGV
jgi:hypothetical protein